MNAQFKELMPEHVSVFPESFDCVCSTGLIVVVADHAVVPKSVLTNLQVQMQLLLPKANIMLSCCDYGAKNEGTALQEGDIDLAAVHLAHNVSARLESLGESHGDGIPVSFLCLGIGGLIARAALAWMRAKQDSLLTFVSIDTPHLGLYGPFLSWRCWCRLWLWRMSSRSRLWMDQVMLTDGRRAHGSRLHRLCDAGNYLALFERIIFIGTDTDPFVPLCSSIVLPGGLDMVGGGAKAENVTAFTPAVHALRPFQAGKIMLLFFPMLWLARLRAWNALLGMLALCGVVLLLPSPPGQLGLRIEAVKTGLRDFVETVSGKAETDFDQKLATCLVASLEDRLMRVDATSADGTWWLNHGFCPGVLLREEWVEALLQRYGHFLLAPRIQTKMKI
mmetsp:Transcript_24529/g.46307  ORF Transcript_24529/g.46307 Transcript_24529/m.46307 type:complete len:391 (+) Transcript_24529:106-1278(+)